MTSQASRATSATPARSRQASPASRSGTAHVRGHISNSGTISRRATTVFTSWNIRALPATSAIPARSPPSPASPSAPALNVCRRQRHRELGHDHRHRRHGDQPCFGDHPGDRRHHRRHHRRQHGRRRHRLRRYAQFRARQRHVHLQQQLHQFRDRQCQFRHGGAQRREQQRHDRERNAGGTLAGNGTIDPPVGNGIMVYAGGTFEPAAAPRRHAQYHRQSVVCFTAADYLDPVIAQRQATPRWPATPARRRHRGAGARPDYRAAQYSILYSTPDVAASLAATSTTFAGAADTATTAKPDAKLRRRRRLSDVRQSYVASILAMLPPGASRRTVVNVANGIDNFINGGGTLAGAVHRSVQPDGAAIGQCAHSNSTARAIPAPAPARSNCSTTFFNLLSDMALGTGGGGGASPGSGATGFAEPDDAFPPDWRSPITKC